MNQSNILKAVLGIAVFVLMFGLSWGVTKIVTGKLLPALGMKAVDGNGLYDPLFFPQRMMATRPLTVSVIQEKGEYSYIRIYAGSSPVSPVMMYPKKELEDKIVTIVENNSMTTLGTARIASSTREARIFDKAAVARGSQLKAGEVCIHVGAEWELFPYMNEPTKYSFPGFLIPCEITLPTLTIKQTATILTSQVAGVAAVLKGENTEKPVILLSKNSGVYDNEKNKCGELLGALGRLASILTDLDLELDSAQDILDNSVDNYRTDVTVDGETMKRPFAEAFVNSMQRMKNKALKLADEKMAEAKAACTTTQSGNELKEIANIIDAAR